MASSSHRGGDFYGAASHRSRDGLSTRPVGGSDEIQLRIDPMHGDLDDEITGLRKQVKQLRNEELELLGKLEKASAACKEMLNKVETRPDPLLPATNGPANPSWDRWFEGLNDIAGCRCWIW